MDIHVRKSYFPSRTLLSLDFHDSIPDQKKFWPLCVGAGKNHDFIAESVFLISNRYEVISALRLICNDGQFSSIARGSAALVPFGWNHYSKRLQRFVCL